MALPAIVAGAGAVAGAGSALIGELIAAGRREEAEAIIQAAYEKYGSVTPEALEDVAAEVLGPSAMSEVQTDPRLRSAQLNALDVLTKMGREGGLLAEDRAVLNQLNQESEAAARGQQAQLLEQMAARGQLNSGALAQMQQASAQQAAQRGQQRALTTAGQAQQRYLDSVLQAGRLGGEIRGQDFGEASARAQADDAIAKANAGARERAALFNRELAQKRNEYLYRNSDRALQGATAKANIKAGQAAQAQQVASGVGSALNAGAGAAAQYLASDADAKKKRGY